MSFLRKNEKVFTCSISYIEELCTLNLKLKNTTGDKQNLSISGSIQSTSSINVSYSQSVMICRKLIFLDKLVLASPLNANGNICVTIIPKSHITDYQFLDTLDKLDLEMGYQSGSFDPALLETCLKYTITAKIAPEWNKVGNLFIEGSRFLESKGRQNGIEFNVNVRHNEACFELSFFHVTLAELKLEEVVHSQTTTAEFMKMKIDSLNENHFMKRWCHVLPSMKKGEICLVTRKLPQDGMFNNYGEMKIYWKNMYGYILPEDECDNLYFLVNFRMLGNTLFTYPSCCLQLCQPIQVPHTPQKVEECLDTFLREINVHIPTICGKQWLSKASIFKPTFQLQSASSFPKYSCSENQGKLTEKSESNETAAWPSCKTKIVEEMAPDSYIPRVNLIHENKEILKTPYVPRFGIVAAFGNCQQPKLTATCSHTKKIEDTNGMLLTEKARKEETKTVPKIAHHKLSQHIPRNDNTVKKNKTRKENPKESKEDIVLLAQQNKLSKVSNVNMLRWLKEMGVPCNPKLRKTELINKVTEFVEMSAQEE